MTDASMSMDEIGKTRKPLAEFWKRFLRQKVALVALAFLILLIGAAILAPWIYARYVRETGRRT